MLKARITLWKLDKKAKWKDMCTAAHMIALKVPDRPVKGTRFRVRHRIVTWKELVTYFKRKKIDDPIQWIQARYMDTSELSSDVVILTPRTSLDGAEDDSMQTEIVNGSMGGSPSLHRPLVDHDGNSLATEDRSCEINQETLEMVPSNGMPVSAISPTKGPSTPINIRRADEVLWHMRDYCNGYIGSVWDLKHSEPPIHHQTTHGLFGHRIQDGVSFILQGKVNLGFESLNSAFGLIAELLRDHHPMALAQLITVICELVARGTIPLVQQLLIHIKDMSCITLGPVLPITAIFETLLHAEGDVTYLLLSAMQIAIGTFNSAATASRWKIMYLKERLCDCLFHVGDENERIRLRSNLLRSQEKHYGENARNVLWTLSNVADDQLLRGDLVEAEAIYRDLLSRADSLEGFGRAKNRFAALEGLAKVAIARAQCDAVSERAKEHAQTVESSRTELREACDLLLEAEAVGVAWFDVSSRRTLRVRAKLADIQAWGFQIDR